MSSENTHYTICWFRQDLRLADNPALLAALNATNVIPVYILDEHHAAEHKMGAAKRWWLHHALLSLDKSLLGRLQVFSAPANSVIEQLCNQYNVTDIYWNRCYEPWRISRDRLIKEELTCRGIRVHTFNASLLCEPWQVLKSDGKPYKVFTAYYKAARREECNRLRMPLQAPARELIQNHVASLAPIGLTIQKLNLLPVNAWYTPFSRYWSVGEKGASEQAKLFYTNTLKSYQKGRDYPALQATSRLSPYLASGEISPNQLWHVAQAESDNLERFKTEIFWREFSYYQLYHYPQLPSNNMNPRFNHFAWQYNANQLDCWQKGITGYPIVDAGMRELWQTGYMHNRVRMIVASFLVKNLMHHWTHGANWFWDCLLDADLANNSASWQWVAGSGADAAPYFRIFNPVLQGEKFDKCGTYTRHFLPELERLPNKYLFKPWQAPANILLKAGITLGKDYPLPIVDLKLSRLQALEAYQRSKLQ